MSPLLASLWAVPAPSCRRWLRPTNAVDNPYRSSISDNALRRFSSDGFLVVLTDLLRLYSSRLYGNCWLALVVCQTAFTLAWLTTTGCLFGEQRLSCQRTICIIQQSLKAPASLTPRINSGDCVRFLFKHFAGLQVERPCSPVEMAQGYQACSKTPLPLPTGLSQASQSSPLERAPTRYRCIMRYAKNNR